MNKGELASKLKKGKMFNKFAAALHSAVEALAPSQSLQEDFVYHWKAVTHYFINNKDDKKPVQESNIPSHLNQMLEILVNEEAEMEDNLSGPCMEYLLQHKTLETLHSLGKADCPPGMKGVVLTFFTKLLRKIKQPLLPHVNVYKPIGRLVKVCGEIRAGPTEIEEIQFLCIVCAKIRQDPYLVNFFIEGDVQGQGQKSTGSVRRSPSQVPMEFSLLDSLLALVQSPDSKIAVKACEGLLLIASLPEKHAAQCISEHPMFCTSLAERLCSLYTALPLSMDPVDVESVEAKWGLELCNDSEDTAMFHGKRQLISLLSWYDYCDQIVNESHPMISRAIARKILEWFFIPILEPLLLQSSEAGIVTSTAHLTKLVKMTTSPELLSEFVYFILGNGSGEEKPGDNSHKLRHRLIERCDHLSDEISIMSLRLFEVLLQKPHQHIFQNLVLRNLKTRAYHDRPLPSPSLNQGSPGDSGIETEAISNGPFITHEGSVPGSPLSVPGSPARSLNDSDVSPHSEPADDVQGIHRVVNCFLSLLPDVAKSSYITGDVGYDMYLRDAHKHYKNCLVQCLAWDWPSHPLPLERCTNSGAFYEGYFMKVLLDKVSRMLDQPYEVNLQMTLVISKIAHLPHPHIHELFLDPYLPVAPGCRTLFTVLNRVVMDLKARMRALPDFQSQMIVVRKQLMGMVEEEQSLPHIDLLEAVIVLEEFCKELAAIAFVKHHTSSCR
ncbi:protein FAM160B1-like isoform X2 [Anneissia japonica]|uniref:protein FAM160B1-like isoform X2 n=1 Tax=Anneissia japonica TaxID=1529436 RepID=UPI0014255BEB|nr:protein FAM160B1-like isoform X2 [Anneissia japonica]